VATQSKADQSSGSNGGFEKKDAIRILAGAAALGFAGRSIMKNSRRPRVLGVRLPRDLADLDTKQLAKRLSRLAAQIEHASEDVRIASAQTKRVADRIA
jgi:hypothetical protein